MKPKVQKLECVNISKMKLHFVVCVYFGHAEICTGILIEVFLIIPAGVQVI